MISTSYDLRTDCLVVGGGPAGYGAAAAALEGGISVTLVERHGFLGGMGTAAGLSCYLNHGLENVDVSDVVYRQLISRLAMARSHYHDPIAQADFFEPEACKRIMESYLIERGGRVIYHSLLENVRRVGNEWNATFLCKGGRIQISSDYLVDATGDGDASFHAGAGMTYGRRSDGLAQPMTMVVQVGGFDPAAWAQAGGRLVQQRFASAGDCFNKEIALARAAGEWTIPRNTIAMFWSMPSDPTRVSINGTRVLGLNACKPLEMSQAEAEGRRQALELLGFFRKYIPGFSTTYIIQTGPQLGVRESRRIVGRDTLEESAVRAGLRPASSVVYCAYPIDVHEPNGSETHFEMGEQRKIYGIPWGCLLPQSLENIVAAGRCISATHEAAGSFRVMPTSMGLGEAAGTGVAIAVKNHRKLSEVSPSEIRAIMEDRREQSLRIASNTQA